MSLKVKGNDLCFQYQLRVSHYACLVQNWSSNNTVDLPIIQSIFQHNWSSNDTADPPIIQSIFRYNNTVDLLVKHRNNNCPPPQ